MSQNKCLHSGRYHQGGSEPGLEKLTLDNLYIPTTSLTSCFFFLDDSRLNADTCFDTE